MTHHTDKAYAYVTWEGQLLVFEHPKHPEAGIQVPGGTIESGESPGEAVVREVREEADLTDVEIVEKLGTDTFDMSKWRDEIQERHFYWLRYTGTPPENWRGYERDHGAPIPLDFYWVELDEIPELHAGQGEYLGRLLEPDVTEGDL